MKYKKINRIIIIEASKANSPGSLTKAIKISSFDSLIDAMKISSYKLPKSTNYQFNSNYQKYGFTVLAKEEK